MSDVVIEVLGSAGAVPTPRVGCPCEICAEALEKAPPLFSLRPVVLRARAQRFNRYP